MSFTINLQSPNPFTLHPIPTDFDSNELLLTDQKLRVKARVAIEDAGMIESSRFFNSPMHLQPGWKWKL